MFNHYTPGDLALPSRRKFLQHSGMGLGSLALATMLAETTRAATSPASPSVDALPARGPHFAPRAKAVIWLFMTGAPSQVDTFDYKPTLQKMHGEKLPGSDSKTGFFTTSGKCLKSPFGWNQYGQSGSWVSDLFPHLSRHVDDMAFIHSMYLRANNHAPASIELMCGSTVPGRPAAGAWATYGLGSMNQNLPAYVVMHGQKPRGDDQIWSAGFLPKTYGALALDARRKEEIDNLVRPKDETDAQQRAALDLLREVNSDHARTRPTQADLISRINSFELAYRMQSTAPEAMDYVSESEATKKLYGIDNKECETFARQCLIARRLVERGVRFVQIFAGRGSSGDGSVGDVPWDGHNNIEANHRSCAAATDQPAAALLADLKSRGMLDDTLVIWGGEFGRTSDSQGSVGRDHNPNGFTIWMAGGGVKGGCHHGSTDEFGYKAVEHKVHVNDLHATILHLLGLDHEKLTYRYSGRDFRLTDVGGHVIPEILANPVTLPLKRSASAG
ncbi:DUF1501 domain-containing protein [Humisphaera borealis]|uniref:DUF1501 domain-containing protein n=1 Tax=Humisphaera borealis TaxID=2807512 RepID=A0A7M2WY80_9BACT|nr:DUF1501 domain-containing protein [Humisphaera borealis]QOV90379.1 DUF1501 domain-containing protein [Humisphaera borealis]